MTTENTNTNTTNTDGRHIENRDGRYAIEILRDAYAVNDESDYAIQLADHAQRVKDAETHRLKRIENGEASAMELLAEGFNHATEQTQKRKEARLARQREDNAKANRNAKTD